MLNGATVTLAGYVAREPIYTKVNDTTPKVIVRVAWSSRYVDRVTGEWRDGKTSFANVNCWRRLGSNVVMSMRKGQPVVVTGRLQVREYDDKEGRRRTAVDIEADAIGHDLSRGVGIFRRLRPEETGDQAQRDGLITADGTVENLPDLSLAGPVTDGQAFDGPAGSGQAQAGEGQEEAGDALTAEAMAELVEAETEKAGAAAPF
jgi:single-strand DNA-binding protein